MVKLQKLIFAGIIIFLPSQLGLHFWPSWAYVNGIRVDYFSPTLYFTDVLILILVILEGAKRPMSKLAAPPLGSIKKMLSLRSSMTIFFIAVFILLNIYFSYSPSVSIYKWLKVLELGFLVWFITKNLQLTIKNLKFLIIPIFYESILAIWQFVNQASVGGLWYFLGERTFNSSTPGIANAVINGQMVLRPYGTFPHPNVLTGFLIITGLILLKFIPQISRKITALVLVMVIVVLFLTPSRGNLLNGLNIRQQFNNVAINKWISSPVLGTGLGTSPLYATGVKNYALAHQPTHNIYLMLLSETGAIGLGFFVFLIIQIFFKIKNLKFKIILIIILFLGLFDHYWLTLQQGQLLLALVLGLSSIIKKS